MLALELKSGARQGWSSPCHFQCLFYFSSGHENFSVVASGNFRSDFFDPLINNFLYRLCTFLLPFKSDCSTMGE